MNWTCYPFSGTLEAEVLSTVVEMLRGVDLHRRPSVLQATTDID
jgi:hypothetical protein